MKHCSTCKIQKSLSDFYKHKSYSDGVRSECKECFKSYCRNRKGKENEYRMRVRRSEKRSEYMKAYALKKKYGLSLREYDQKLISQNGLCSICSKSHLDAHNGLYVDHDHSTNQVRDLLCRDCNAGLGYFLENPDLLVMASEYLKRHKIQKLHFIKGDL